MRVIDADALAEEIKKNMDNGFPANEYLSLYALSCIAHAPTVDVLEQIRAEIVNINVIRDEYSQRQNDYCDGVDFAKKYALHIIDKYKEEIEE